MSKEKDFIIWQGGDMPVAKDTVVQAQLQGMDGCVIRPACEFSWTRTNYGGVIAYRVVEQEKPKAVIPEGFTPWSGGKCPVGLQVKVQPLLRNGRLKAGEALLFNWTNTNKLHGIVAYRVVEQEKPLSARDTQVGGDHYKTAEVQPWDVVDTWPMEQQIGFYRGNALKYVLRMGTKDENLTEIRKAAHYLQKLVEVLGQKGGV